MTAAAWSAAAVRATSWPARRWSDGGANWTTARRTGRGCPSAEVHRFTSSGCADGTEVVFVAVDGGGHEWFGGASEASAQFFATHAR